MGALDGFNVGYGRRVAPRKESSKQKELLGYLVVRTRADGVRIVCRTRGEYTISPVLVSYNEASLALSELHRDNVQEKYSIVEVYA